MKKSLKELLNKVLAKLNDIGTTYTASWTATSASALDDRLTNSLTLPKGKYVVMVRFPLMSATQLVGLYGVSDTYITSVGNNSTCLAVDLSADITTWLFKASAGAATYSYLERGGLTAIRIA